MWRSHDYRDNLQLLDMQSYIKLLVLLDEVKGITKVIHSPGTTDT